MKPITSPLLLLLFSLSSTIAKCNSDVCFKNTPSEGNCDSTKDCIFSSLNAWSPSDRTEADDSTLSKPWLVSSNEAYHVRWEVSNDTYPVRLAWHFHNESTYMNYTGPGSFTPIQWSKNFTKETTSTILNFEKLLYEDFPNDETNLTTWEAFALVIRFKGHYLSVSQPENPVFQPPENGIGNRALDLSDRFSPQVARVEDYLHAAENRARHDAQWDSEKRVKLGVGIGVGLGVPLAMLACTALGYFWGKRKTKRRMEKMRHEGGLQGEEMVKVRGTE